jgi:predicted transcriptional regulator of viral defense system
MNDIEKLIDNTGLLLTREAIKQGFSKHSLYGFIRANNYEQVAHGIYASPETWEDEEYILSLRCPQAVFSHDVALYYHNLVDREPMKRTITVYTGYGTSRLVQDGIKVFTVNKELLNIGKEYANTSLGHTIPLYDIERTICDLVRSRSWFEIQDYQAALKNYLKRTHKDLNKLMEYAQLFHVDKKIREYMEVLL